MKYFLYISLVLQVLLFGCATQVTSTPEFKLVHKESISVNPKVLFSVHDARANAHENIETSIKLAFSNSYNNALEPVPYFIKTPDSRVHIKLRIVKLEANFNSFIQFNASQAYTNTYVNSTAFNNINNTVIRINSELQESAGQFSMSGSGRWYGATWINFELYDNRGGRHMAVVPIVAYADEFNMWGNMTAKSVQNKTWNEALSKFSMLLDAILIDIINQ